MPSCGCEPYHVGSLQKVYSSVSDPSWKGETYFGCIYVQSSPYTNKVSKGLYKVSFQKLAIILLHRTDYSVGPNLQADFFNLYIVLGFDYHGYLMLMPVF